MPRPPRAPGNPDVNDDGNVDLTDVLAIYNKIGTTDLTYDINRDGRVDQEDVNLALRRFGEIRVSDTATSGTGTVWTRMNIATGPLFAYMNSDTSVVNLYDAGVISATAITVPVTVVKDADHLVGIHSPIPFYFEGSLSSNRNTHAKALLFASIELSTGDIAIAHGHSSYFSNNEVLEVKVEVWDGATWTTDTLTPGTVGPNQVRVNMVEFNSQIWVFIKRDSYKWMSLARYTLAGVLVDFTEQFVPKQDDLSGPEGELCDLQPVVIGSFIYLAYQCMDRMTWSISPFFRKGARVQLLKIATDKSFTKLARFTNDWAERYMNMYLFANDAGTQLNLIYTRMASAADTTKQLATATYTLATNLWSGGQVLFEGDPILLVGEQRFGRFTVYGRDLWLHDFTG